MFFDRDEERYPLSEAGGSDEDWLRLDREQIAGAPNAFEQNRTSNWAASDCRFDPEDPYNPWGPHHRPGGVHND